MWEGTKKRMAAHADALKAWTGAALRGKASEVRKAIGPEKAQSIKEPERPFGKENGGEDVKRVVWTGHTITSPEGKSYYGAVGLTQDGYFRAAQVQVYGSDETWRWQQQRHTARQEAVSSAGEMAANRLTPEPKSQKRTDVASGKHDSKEQNTMTDKPIPEAAKAQLEAIRKQLQADAAKIPVEAKPANAAPMREGAERAQEKIAQMARDGQDATAITKAASKEDFRR